MNTLPTPYLPQSLAESYESLFRDRIQNHAIDENRLVNELSILCSQNTYSYNKEGQIAFAKIWKPSYFSRLGEYREIGSETDTKLSDFGPIITSSIRRNAPKQLLFSGHYDTVFPSTSSFQTCLRDQENLIGPGVSDMKGGLIIMREALALYEALSFPQKESIGWTSIITPDEEIGSHASKSYLQSYVKDIHGKNALGIVLEPTMKNGSHVLHRPGSLTIQITAHGKSAHAGRDFWEGRNAVTALIELLFHIEKAFLALGEKKESPHKTTMNIASIEGGSASNIIPHIATACINIRSDAQHEIDRLTHSITTIINMKPRDGIRFEYSIESTRPPKPVTSEVESIMNLYLHALHATPRTSLWERSGGVSDGNFLQAFGLPCLDGMGVTGGGLHTEQEWCCIKSLSERIRDIVSFMVFLAHLPEESLPKIQYQDAM